MDSETVETEEYYRLKGEERSEFLGNYMRLLKKAVEEGIEFDKSRNC